MGRRFVTGLVCLSPLLLSSGCNSLEPEDRLFSQLSVTPLHISAGQSVYVTVTVTNEGSVAAQSSGCGPGFGYVVKLPDGSLRYPLEGLAYICPMFDSNVIEPGETDELTFEWQPPAIPGTYALKAGLRGSNGLRSLSAVKTFEVQ